MWILAGNPIQQVEPAINMQLHTLIEQVFAHHYLIAKFENLVPRLQESLGLQIQTKRTQERSNSAKVLPYAVEVVSIDRGGIVSDVANFFARRSINIEDVFTSTYPAPHTHTDMFSLHMTVGIPGEMSIAAVRGEFMDFCDDLNLDAVLAPVK